MFNLPGNILCRQMIGDTARLVSERLGRILKPKQSFNTDSRDTSTHQSEQLDLGVPASKIAALSSGQFSWVWSPTIPARRSS